MQRLHRSLSDHHRPSRFRTVVLPTLAGAAILVALTTQGCGRSAAAAERTPTERVVTIVTEDIATVERRELSTGPIISGTLSARRHASIRAEIGGLVTGVYADRGTEVASGAPLMRIDGRSIQEAQVAATADLRTDEDALAVAERRLTRSVALLAGGAISAEAVEDARQVVSAAASKVALSKARLVSATEAYARTTVRAPFSGIVSARAANAGDNVESGNVLFEILDPTAMRLEGSVPAADLPAIHVGAPIAFSITGYPGRTFKGRIERVNPSADATTRQIPVFVSIDNADGKLVAGLFAEGRATPTTGATLLVPGSAVERANGSASVVLLAGGRIERRPVVTGREAPDGGFVEVQSGLALGDTVVIGVSRSLPTGTAARVSSAKTGAPAAAPINH